MEIYSRSKIIPLIAFVDWNNQIHKAKRHKNDMPSVEFVLDKVFNIIKNNLKDFLNENKFEIVLRLYCGWHKGFEQTSRRKDLARISTEEIFKLSSHRNIVVRNLEYGDTAIGALERRKVKSTNSHFPATCRDRGYHGIEEKMVDTALVSDLIYCAASLDEKSWLAVLGEDIDFIPGLYTAEKFIFSSTRKIAYLRSERDPYLNCDDMYKFNKD